MDVRGGHGSLRKTTQRSNRASAWSFGGSLGLLDGLFLRHAGHETGVVGTIEYRIRVEARPASQTTPEAVDLQGLLAEMVERGVTAAAMEVSSHALELSRVDGVAFDVAVFTNLTQDHLDFHGSMEAYFAAKRRLFEGGVSARPRWAVVNVDDEYGRRLADEFDGPILRFGRDRGADVRAERWDLTLDGLVVEVSTPTDPDE